MTAFLRTAPTPPGRKPAGWAPEVSPVTYRRYDPPEYDEQPVIWARPW